MSFFFCWSNMPNPSDFTEESEWMSVCVPKMVEEGREQEQAIAACTQMWRDKSDAEKYRVSFKAAIKAVGDYELDVLAIPFNVIDSDGQWFDSNTDIMESAFKTPLVLYQHGVKQGANGIEDKPIVIGETMPGSLVKKTDGWHLRVRLNQALQKAKDIMAAAWKGMVAVSSDSISHLARLQVGDKTIEYQKKRPGRISVWALAGISLWELGNGNLRPASRTTFALPAMKALYRDNNKSFPALNISEASPKDLKRSEAHARIRAKAQSILSKKRKTS